MIEETTEELNSEEEPFAKLGNYIFELRCKFGVSVKQLCQDCHISYNTYLRVFKLVKTSE